MTGFALTPLVHPPNSLHPLSPHSPLLVRRNAPSSPQPSLSRLLFYGVLSLGTFVAFMTPRFVLSCTRVVSILDIFVIFAWVLAVLLGLVLTLFFGFHCWLCYKAYTTIEFCEKRNAPASKTFEDSTISVKEVYSRSLFDLGLCPNIRHMLGENCCVWFLPLRTGMSNDGTHFRTRDDFISPFQGVDVAKHEL